MKKKVLFSLFGLMLFAFIAKAAFTPITTTEKTLFQNWSAWSEASIAQNAGYTAGNVASATTATGKLHDNINRLIELQAEEDVPTFINYPGLINKGKNAVDWITIEVYRNDNAKALAGYEGDLTCTDTDELDDALTAYNGLSLEGTKTAEQWLPGLKDAIVKRIQAIKESTAAATVQACVSKLSDIEKERTLRLGSYEVSTDIGAVIDGTGSDYQLLKDLYEAYALVRPNGTFIEGISATDKLYIEESEKKINRYNGIYTNMEVAHTILTSATANNYVIYSTASIIIDIDGKTILNKNASNNDVVDLQHTAKNGEMAKLYAIKTYIANSANSDVCKYIYEALPENKINTLYDNAVTVYKNQDLTFQSSREYGKFVEKYDDAINTYNPTYVDDITLAIVQPGDEKAEIETIFENITEAINTINAYYKAPATSSILGTTPYDAVYYKAVSANDPLKVDAALNLGEVGDKRLEIGKQTYKRLVTNKDLKKLGTLQTNLYAAAKWEYARRLYVAYKNKYNQYMGKGVALTTAEIDAENGTPAGIEQNKNLAEAAREYWFFGTESSNSKGTWTITGGVNNKPVSDWKWNSADSKITDKGSDESLGTNLITNAKELIKLEYTYLTEEDVEIDLFYGKAAASNFLTNWAYGEDNLYSKVTGDVVAADNLTDINDAISQYTLKGLDKYENEAWAKAAKDVYDALVTAKELATADNLSGVMFAVYSYDGTVLNREYPSVKTMVELGEYLAKPENKNKIANVNKIFNSETVLANLPTNVVVLKTTEDGNIHYANKIELTEGAYDYYYIPYDITAGTVVYNKAIFKTETPYYLPFDVTVDELEEVLPGAEARKMNAVFEKEESSTEHSLVVKWKLVDEVLYANMPYKLTYESPYTKKEENVALTFKNKTIPMQNVKEKTPGMGDYVITDGSVKAETTTATFTLRGVDNKLSIKPRTDTDDTNIVGQWQINAEKGIWGRIEMWKSEEFGLKNSAQNAKVGRVVMTVATKPGINYTILHEADEDAEATGISAIKGDNKIEGIYTISGQKVNSMAKPGLYVVNGKKVLVK